MDKNMVTSTWYTTSEDWEVTDYGIITKKIHLIVFRKYITVTKYSTQTDFNI